jgi:2-amino-4-hydroxy-6-hydroxymethyldihydropteridine diphosphokinase
LHTHHYISGANVLQMAISSEKNTLIVLSGTNLGEKEENLKNALLSVQEKIGKVTEVSPVHWSEPWGFESDEKFANQVFVVETKLKALKCLKELLSIEEELGRIRTPTAKGYSDRLIDLDILFYNSEIIDSPDLTVPHPELHKRDFTLKPLAKILPDFIHPILGKSCKELLQDAEENKSGE